MRGARDQSFEGFVAEGRPALAACAVLLWGDPDRGQRAVDLALARLSAAWPPRGDYVLAAYRYLLAADPEAPVPWRREDRVRLTDDARSRPPVVGILGEVAGLPLAERQALICSQVAGLTPGQIAALQSRTAGEVAADIAAAARRLTERDPARHHAATLTEQLRRAAPASSSDGAEDRRRGQLLRRRRGRRTVGAAAAGLLVVAFGVAQLGREGPEEPAPPPPVSTVPTVPTVPTIPSPSRPRPTCDPVEPGCRAELVRAWRSRMAAVTSSYLDPHHRYFSGYSYAYTDSYDSPGWWTGQGGVLGFDMFREQSGATEVFVQVASDRRFAPPCGQTIGRSCVSMRFLDGNSFTLSDSTDTAHGIEVQYCPEGTEVITVVARNQPGGRPLDLDRADLIRLVQDPRLRLPQR